MATLGFRKETGALSAANLLVPGAWLITFKAQVMPTDADFEIWHGAIRGPGGYFLVYIDNALFGVGENGLINEYAPAGSAMFVRKGQEVTMHWSISTGAAPQAWFWFREPEVGRL